MEHSVEKRFSYLSGQVSSCHSILTDLSIPRKDSKGKILSLKERLIVFKETLKEKQLLNIIRSLASEITIDDLESHFEKDDI